MRKLSYKKFLLGFVLCILILSSVFMYAKFFVYKNELSAQVLVVYKSGTQNYLDTYQNYSQSYILNTKVDALDDLSFLGTDITSYDVVYPDVSLINSPNITQIKEKLTTYASKGGYLFLENEWHNVFPTEFTGVSSYSKYNGSRYSFTYPTVSYNLTQLQLVLKNFFDNFTEYRKDDLKKLSFNTAILSTAKSLIDLDGNSIAALNKYGNGCVLTTSSLIPNKSFITGFDLTAKNDNQKHFDYTFSTLNYFVRNEYLAFSLKEKYGYTFKKVFGPYGRPAMAWQNHYEALTSIMDKEAIDWIDLLKDYNQIPSYSLIRSTYDWGQWKPNITVHINIGSKASPKFVGEYENSYYSSGQRIEGKDSYITFGHYPDTKSLNDPIDKAVRAYPAVVDYDNDGDSDLIIGSHYGALYLLKNVGTKNKPEFLDKEEIKITNYIATNNFFAAPAIYDINKDGLYDIILGNKSGSVNVLINQGQLGSPVFNDISPLKDTDGNIIKTEGTASPTIGDINNDNIPDLVLGGSSSSSVIIYKGTFNGFVYSSKFSNPNIEAFPAPAIYDWNNDEKNDLLIGDNSGYIKLFTASSNGFTYWGNIEGQTNNPKGNKGLLGGHNSVPVVTDWNCDGLDDLLVGQLEFGLPYDIDNKFFPYKEQLKEIIAYSKSHGVPIYPHFFTHKYKSPEQEKRELELHKKAFAAYGLEWNKTGTDQHTWRTNNLNPQQTLLSELNSDIWWNFGFNPSNQPDLPRDGKEYLWSTPFLLSNNTDKNNFIAYTPSPNLFMYPKAYSSFAALDMPVIYFEHIEYRFSNPKGLDELKQMASFLNSVRKDGEYNFITQEQMAKSFMNAFYTTANVRETKGGISIKPDIKSVPELAGNYKGTLGVKFERGEKLKDMPISVNSSIQYKKDDDLYFGLNDDVKLSFSQAPDDFYIVRTNVPIEISNNKDKMNIKFLDSGMQEIKIYSKYELDIQGERIKLQKEGSYYTVTHYGYPITVTITKK